MSEHLTWWDRLSLWWYRLTRHDHTEECRDALPLEWEISFPFDGTEDLSDIVAARNAGGGE